jgi:hypothetical protein
VYWNWELTDDGTPVIADPLAIKSNLLFTEPGGEVDADTQLLGINELVRELPWQQEVMDHLARLRVPTAAARTKRHIGGGRHSHVAVRPSALAA